MNKQLLALAETIEEKDGQIGRLEHLLHVTDELNAKQEKMIEDSALSWRSWNTVRSRWLMMDVLDRTSLGWTVSTTACVSSQIDGLVSGPSAGGCGLPR